MTIIALGELIAAAKLRRVMQSSNHLPRVWMRSFLAISAFVAIADANAQSPRRIIDMHLHTFPFEKIADSSADRRAQEIWQRAMLDSLNHYNVVLALLSGSYPIARKWANAAPGRFIVAAEIACEEGRLGPAGTRDCFENRAAFPDVMWLRSEHAAGRLGALGEVASQYMGLFPTDTALERYWQLAEELDIPVALHMGMGPPGAAHKGSCGVAACAPNYRIQLSNPMLLEPVLVRHPKLRIYIMHAGWPYLDELLGLMYAHPQVYADIAVWWAVMPKEEFQAQLLRLVRGGYGNRIMYGSDLPFMGNAIQAIEESSFLTRAQKDDIFYNNAVRFLRLNDRARARPD